MLFSLKALITMRLVRWTFSKILVRRTKRIIEHIKTLIFEAYFVATYCPSMICTRRRFVLLDEILCPSVQVDMDKPPIGVRGFCPRATPTQKMSSWNYQPVFLWFERGCKNGCSSVSLWDLHQAAKADVQKLLGGYGQGIHLG